MPEDKTISRSELLALTGEIVSAHLANNAVAQTDVAALIPWIEWAFENCVSQISKAA